MSGKHNLREFGEEPAPPLLEWLRCLALGTPPSTAVTDLLGTVAAGVAVGRDMPLRRLMAPWRGHPNYGTLPSSVRSVVDREFRAAAARFLAFERQAALLAAAFRPLDIPMILLKGFPLANRVYSHPGHRPMGDLDVAVPEDRFAEAAAILAGLGFVERIQEGHAGRERAGINTHAITFRHATAPIAIDLHCHILAASRWRGADDGFWAQRQPLGPAADNRFILSDEHQLLHTCIHGMTPSFRAPSARWMLDAHHLLARRPDLDWAAVEDAAAQHRCGPVVAACLDYLATTLGEPVPGSAVDRLRSSPARYYDIGFFRSSASVARRPTLYRRAARRWYEGQRQSDRPFTGLGDFMDVVGQGWETRSPVEMLRQLWRRRREPSWLRKKRAAQGEAP